MPLHTASETETVLERDRERKGMRETRRPIHIQSTHSCPATASVLDPDGALGTRWGFFNLTQLLYSFDSKRFELGDP